jgi:hypothetical protein
MANQKQSSLQRYFSLRHEFPTEWYKFLHPAGAATRTAPVSSMQINLSQDRFPFQYRGMKIAIARAELFVVFDGSIPAAPPSDFTVSVSNPPNQPNVQLSKVNIPNVGNAQYFSTVAPPKTVPNQWTLQCSGDLSPVADVFLLCEFSAS